MLILSASAVADAGNFYGWVGRSGALCFSDIHPSVSAIKGEATNRIEIISEIPDIPRVVQLQRQLQEIKEQFIEKISYALSHQNYKSASRYTRILSELLGWHQPKKEEEESPRPIASPMFPDPPTTDYLIRSGSIYIGTPSGKIYYPSGKGMVLDSQTGWFVPIQ